MRVFVTFLVTVAISEKGFHVGTFCCDDAAELLLAMLGSATDF